MIPDFTPGREANTRSPSEVIYTFRAAAND